MPEIFEKYAQRAKSKPFGVYLLDGWNIFTLPFIVSPISGKPSLIETRMFKFLFGKSLLICCAFMLNKTRVESDVKSTSLTTPFTETKSKESLICGVLIMCVKDIA